MQLFPGLPFWSIIVIQNFLLISISLDLYISIWIYIFFFFIIIYEKLLSQRNIRSMNAIDIGIVLENSRILGQSFRWRITYMSMAGFPSLVDKLFRFRGKCRLYFPIEQCRIDAALPGDRSCTTRAKVPLWEISPFIHVEGTFVPACTGEHRLFLWVVRKWFRRGGCIDRLYAAVSLKGREIDNYD